MNLGPEGLLVWQIRSENSRQKEDSRKEEAEKHRKRPVLFRRTAALRLKAAAERKHTQKQVYQERKAPQEKFSLPVAGSPDGRKISGEQIRFPAEGRRQERDGEITEKIKKHRKNPPHRD